MDWVAFLNISSSPCCNELNELAFTFTLGFLLWRCLWTWTLILQSSISEYSWGEREKIIPEVHYYQISEHYDEEKITWTLQDYFFLLLVTKITVLVDISNCRPHPAALNWMSCHFFVPWLLVAWNMVFNFSGHGLRNFRVVFLDFLRVREKRYQRFIKAYMCIDLSKCLPHPSCNEMDELSMLLPLHSFHRMACFLFLFRVSRHGHQYFKVQRGSFSKRFLCNLVRFGIP